MGNVRSLCNKIDEMCPLIRHLNVRYGDVAVYTLPGMRDGVMPDMLPCERTLSFPLPAPQMTLIFIYGTLKKGQPNHYRMLDTAEGNARFLGRAHTVDKYPLVIAGKFNIPFLLNVPGEGKHVQGEIYSVDDSMVKFLDWFEGCPQMYQRTKVLLAVEDWVGEGEETLQVGSITDAFVYSTTTYKPEWLLYTTFDSYDAYGDHGLQYVKREDRD